MEIKACLCHPFVISKPFDKCDKTRMATGQTGGKATTFLRAKGSFLPNHKIGIGVLACIIHPNQLVTGLLRLNINRDHLRQWWGIQHKRYFMKGRK
ncbi:hypothetical protein L1987_16616 [Smallanthus sonchifolius]|uniref:Uncharacterized protein n=1 Tax=Smallanthus sonchifolius TaxID=185202 RepID=A0ACB9IV96_9ASTR|nr:hypothetical protein L1987_16616 [Smallanthus sonchifolius]